MIRISLLARPIALGLCIIIGARWASAAPVSAAGCTGSVVGRVVMGYGNHAPVADVPIQLTGMPGDPNSQRKLVRTAPDGSFRIDGVPTGWHNGAADHALFAFDLSRCGQTVNVGEVDYPLVHPAARPVPLGPTHPAARALEHFLDAVLARNGPATLAWVTDALRSRAPHGFTGQSNPCLYRYAVLSLIEWTAARPDQLSHGTVQATVDIYSHFWPGDQAGGLPRSNLRILTLVNTPNGWRVSDLGPILRSQEEPTEPHGPTTSACVVSRRPAAWLAAPGDLPATGGVLAPLESGLGFLGLMVLGSGLALRRGAKDRAE